MLVQVQPIDVDQCDLLLKYYWGECSSPADHNLMLSVAQLWVRLTTWSLLMLSGFITLIQASVFSRTDMD